MASASVVALLVGCAHRGPASAASSKSSASVTIGGGIDVERPSTAPATEPGRQDRLVYDSPSPSTK